MQKIASYGLAVLVFTISMQAQAQKSLVFNGQSFGCAGATALLDDHMYCCEGAKASVVGGGVVCGNGRPATLAIQSADLAPCDGARTKRHSNGGGDVDVNASVPSNTFVAAGASVCGPISIGGGSRVEEGANLNGTLRVGRGVTIGKSASVRGSGIIGDNTIIEEAASLNGALKLRGARVRKNAWLNGNIEVIGAEVAGTVRGPQKITGRVRRASPSGTGAAAGEAGIDANSSGN